jgi:hypothetical protein
MNPSSTLPSTWAIDVRIDISEVTDPQKSDRIEQLLFSGSTSVIVASSTGVAL